MRTDVYELVSNVLFLLTPTAALVWDLGLLGRVRAFVAERRRRRRWWCLASAEARAAVRAADLANKGGVPWA